MDDAQPSTSSASSLQQEAAQAQQWLSATGILPKLEKVLNDACRQRPSDHFGFLARRMERCADNPAVEQLVARSCLDDNAQECLEVAAVVRDRLHLIPYPGVLAETCDITRKEQAQSLLNNFTQALDGVDARDLISIERKIVHHFNLIQPAPKPLPSDDANGSQKEDGAPLDGDGDGDGDAGDKRDTRIMAPVQGKWSQNALCAAVSLCLAQTTAALAFESLLESIAPVATAAASTRTKKSQQQQQQQQQQQEQSGAKRSIVFVAPIVKVFSPADTGGKLNVRAIYARCPRQYSAHRAQKTLTSLYRGLQEVVGSMKNASGCGSIDPATRAFPAPFDKLSQAIDAVKSACNKKGLIFAKDVLLMVDVGADRQGVFDATKGRYEIEGAGLKAADWGTAVCNFMSDINTGVAALIDPFHPEDVKSWAKVAELYSPPKEEAEGGEEAGEEKSELGEKGDAEEDGGSSTNSSKQPQSLRRFAPIGTLSVPQRSLPLLPLPATKTNPASAVKRSASARAETIPAPTVASPSTGGHKQYSLAFTKMANTSTLFTLAHAIHDIRDDYGTAILDCDASILAHTPAAVDVACALGADYLCTSFPLFTPFFRRLGALEQLCAEKGIDCCFGDSDPVDDDEEDEEAEEDEQQQQPVSS